MCSEGIQELLDMLASDSRQSDDIMRISEATRDDETNMTRCAQKEDGQERMEEEEAEKEKRKQKQVYDGDHGRPHEPSAVRSLKLVVGKRWPEGMVALS